LLHAGLVAVIPAAAPLAAQQPEPLWEQLRRTFQQEALTVGALLQVVADAQLERTFPGRSGFSIANARIRVQGRLDRGFEYLVRTEFSGAVSLLDARIGYRLTPDLALDAGLFKAPFSREFLTSAGNIDLVNRAQAVSALGPGRQIGVQARGTLAGRWEARAGTFNGNGIAPGGNDSGDLMFAGRLAWWPRGLPGRGATGGTAEVAVSVARSDDAAAPIGLLPLPFAGQRLVYGADTRWRLGRALLAAEIVVAELDRRGPSPAVMPHGWHATAGYHVARRSQALVRWDALRGDGLAPDRDLLILGFNHWPTRATKLQVNWIVDADDTALDRHQALVNLQVGF
jgi:hypothetical protein